MFAFFRQTPHQRALIESDAADLIAHYGDDAYSEARFRLAEAEWGEVLDGNRPEGHWGRVKVAIRRLEGEEESCRQSDAI